MKSYLLLFIFISALTLFSRAAYSQTPGVLTFTFAEVTKSPTYNGNSQHVLAVWVQTSAGAFVKTKLRYVGSGTKDHLPNWTANALCTGGSAVSAGCNTIDGTTGATRSSWTSYNVSWDGQMGPAGTGTLQPDGVYQVSVQSTWNHGTGGTAITSYTFTKGPANDHQTISSDPNFGNILLDWTPSTTTTTTGFEIISANSALNIYPNPTNGVFNIDYAKANHIKVINTLCEVVFDEKIEGSERGTKSVDLSSFANGIYLITVTTEKDSFNQKIILNK